MKKLLYLLLLLPLAFIASCGDEEEDFPQVNLILVIDNATIDNVTKEFYLLKGTPAEVESLKAHSLTSQAAACTGCIFKIDGVQITDTNTEPFSSPIPTNKLSVGDHTLEAYTTILQVDKTIANGMISLPFKVVEKEEDLPGGKLGKCTMTILMQKSK